MSVCISQHGEFGSHALDADYVCTLCGVLDEDALITELREASDRVAELQRQRDAVLALHFQPANWIRRCHHCGHPWPCPTIQAVGGRE